MAALRVAVVSSEIGSACGIAEHSRMLVEALNREAGAGRESVVAAADPAWLDPFAFADRAQDFDVVFLNYHRGLHSRWDAEAVRLVEIPVVITFHDTYETQPDRLPWELLDCPNVRAMVVHERCDLMSIVKARIAYDSRLVQQLTAGPDGARGTFIERNVQKVHYWHQPCPVPYGRGDLKVANPHPLGPWRPTLGTLGFDFPWKNYDLLAEVTNACGWNLHVVGQVDYARQQALRALNPRTTFTGFVSGEWAIAHLSAYDATAFLYTCGNSGTSGAIRAGITAARPLIVAKGCRQFRDLEEAEVRGISWIEPTAGALMDALTGWKLNMLPQISGYVPGLIAFAHQHGWEHYGRKYAELFREAAARG